MKAAVSINWTESGIVTVIRFLHSLKAQLPIDVAPKLMVIEVTELHESKAYGPIEVTVGAIVILQGVVTHKLQQPSAWLFEHVATINLSIINI